MLSNRAIPMVLRDRARAFTLIEIMIVVGIIALLAGLLLNNYVYSLKVGETVASEAQIKQIGNALDVYHTDKHVYPAGYGDYVDTPLFGAFGNNYMTGQPQDNGTLYNYYAGWDGEGYLVRGNYSYDGSLLGGMKDLRGAAVVAGSNYLMSFTPVRGIFAWGPN